MSRVRPRRMRWLAPALIAVLAAGAAPHARAAHDPPADGVSRLALRRVGGGEAGSRLAQRTIEREWGLSDDSIYVAREVPGWRSAPMAAAFSLTLPGAGQLYAGEGRVWLYAAVEAAAVGGWWWHHHESEQLGNDAVRLAGSPGEAGSEWSFDRWASGTSGDPGPLAALYAADREAFYNRIATDPAYAAGWANESARTEFTSLRRRSDQRLSRSRLFAAGVWVNHLVSAMNALRAARHHNLTLPGGGPELRGRLEANPDGLVLALERTF